MSTLGEPSATGTPAAMAAAPERTSKLEVASALRKAGLLTGVKTHLRNVGGTAAFQVAEEAARTPAAIADIVVSAATHKRTVLGTNPAAFARSSYEAATKGMREAREILKHGATDAQMERLQLRPEINSGSKIVDAYTNGVFRLLGAEDQVMRTYAMRRSLEDQARVIALNEATDGQIKGSTLTARTKELIAQPTAEMQATAVADAEFATFNNDNFITSNITQPVRDKLRQSTTGQAVNVGIDLVMPFDRTPTNIVARILEYSTGLPTSVAKLGYKAAAAKVTGRAFTEADQKAFAQTFGRGSVGAATITLGYQLAAKGLLTGIYDDEADERGRNNVQRAAGRSPMALRIGDAWHQVGAFSPLGNLLAVGASIHRETHQDLKHEGERAGRIADIAKDVVMEQPLLSAAKDTFGGNQGKLGDRAGRMAGSLVPTIVNDVGAVVDNKRREAQGFTQQIQARVPGWRQGLPELPDVLGRRVESRRTAFFDPTLTSTAREATNPVDRELVRLDVGISRAQGRVTIKGEQIRLTPDQASAHRQAVGDRIYEALQRMIASPGYQQAPDERKRLLIEKRIEQVREQTSKQLRNQTKKTLTQAR